MRKPYIHILSAILFVLSSVIAKAQVDVTSSGGVTNESYPTLKRAFDSINAGRHSGTITIGISGNTNENAAAVLNASGAGAASYTGITVTATGEGPRTISGSSSTALIVLNGADNVTINGSNGSTVNTVCPLSAASRDLTITKINPGVNSAIVWLQSNGTNGATNNKIINCNLVGNDSAQTLFGIGSGSGAISVFSLGAGNDNNQFINNSIRKTQYGIYSGGESRTNKNIRTIIAQNDINAAAPDNIRKGGILVNFEDTILISGNNIAHLNPGGVSGTVFGINLNVENSNAVITKNKISDLVQFDTTAFSGSTGFGIFVGIDTVSFGATLIINNMVSDIRASSRPSSIAAGIFAGGGTGTTEIYFNTVSMTGARGAATQPGYALAVGSTTPSVDIRNNILVNTQTSSSTGKSYAIGLGYSSTPGNYANLISDNNNFYTSGTSAIALSSVGSFNQTTLTNKTTLADWQAETGSDANSKNVQPVFVSSTDLHLVPGSNPLLENAGIALVGANDDIDCETRHASTPDIGADEISCSSTFYRDNDGDTYGDLNNTTLACSAPAGYVSNSTDCNDNDAAIHPGAVEVCDGIDNNCDGQTDEGVSQTTFYRDSDGDGYGDLNTSVQACSTPTGYVSNSTDCNDNNAVIHPGAVEVCDGIDNNCDGQADEGVPQTTFYRDSDVDTYGDLNNSVQACSAPSGYVSNSTDCNDNNAANHPGAVEVCDGMDNNCDGQTDEGCTTDPTISINDVTVNESAGNVTLTLTLSHSTPTEKKISYKIIDGTAISKGKNKDYKDEGNGTVIIPPGAVSAVITITIYADNIAEGDEQFIVQLTKVINAVLGDNVGTVTIQDRSEPAVKYNINAEQIVVKGLELNAWPNPSINNFTIQINSSNSIEQIILQVFDVYGRKVETGRNIISGSIIRLGELYRPGTYYVRVIQGKDHKELKLIKLAD